MIKKNLILDENKESYTEISDISDVENYQKRIFIVQDFNLLGKVSLLKKNCGNYFFILTNGSEERLVKEMSTSVDTFKNIFVIPNKEDLNILDLLPVLYGQFSDVHFKSNFVSFIKQIYQETQVFFEKVTNYRYQFN